MTAPVQANPNAVVFTTVNSATGNSAAPYCDADGNIQSRVNESGTYTNFTGTNTITKASGTTYLALLGIFVATSSSGTIAISDGATVVVAAFNVIAGTFYPLPFLLSTSCVITVTGTLNATASTR